MKNFKRKTASFALALMLAVIAAAGVFTTGVYAQEGTAAGKKTVYVSAVADYSGVTVNIPKTPVQIDAQETLTEACDRVLAASGLDYTMEWGYPSTISGLGTVDMGNNVWYYWSVYVNGGYASGTAVNDGDEISLIYVTDANTDVMETPDFTDDATLNPDDGAVALLKERLTKAETVLADYIYETVLQGGAFVSGIDSSDALLATYYVYALRQAGFDNDEYYQKVYDNIAEQLRNTSDLSSIEGTYGVSSYAKLVMLVTALGYDAADVGGVNLIEKLTDKNIVAASSSYLREATLLLAMSTGNYAFPVGDAFVTEEEMVNAVIGQVDDAITNSISYGCDMAAMTVQGLWRYYDTNAEAKAACDKVLTFLEKMQAGNGYFSDAYTVNNVWTTAQVMMTMNVFEKSAVSETDGSDFIKNGKTVIDSMLEYFDLENGTVSDTVKGYDPAQVLRGISATVRSLNGEKNIFDCVGNEKPLVGSGSDEPAVNPAPETGDATDITGILVLMVLAAGVMAAAGKKYIG